VYIEHRGDRSDARLKTGRNWLKSKATPLEAEMLEYIRTVQILVLLLVLIASFPLAMAAPGNENKPNIVLVVMDNFGYGEKIEY
jgi:hypothetical protein